MASRSAGAVTSPGGRRRGRRRQPAVPCPAPDSLNLPAGSSATTAPSCVYSRRASDDPLLRPQHRLGPGTAGRHGRSSRPCSGCPSTCPLGSSSAAREWQPTLPLPVVGNLPPTRSRFTFTRPRRAARGRSTTSGSTLTARAEPQREQGEVVARAPSAPATRRWSTIACAPGAAAGDRGGQPRAPPDRGRRGCRSARRCRAGARRRGEPGAQIEGVDVVEDAEQAAGRRATRPGRSARRNRGGGWPPQASVPDTAGPSSSRANAGVTKRSAPRLRIRCSASGGCPRGRGSITAVRTV